MEKATIYWTEWLSDQRGGKDSMTISANRIQTGLLKKIINNN